MPKHFQGINLKAFWDSSVYFKSPEALTPASIRRAEELLGYKLPASYVELLGTQNGGTPVNSCFPTTERTSWAEDHVAIAGICGIGGQWGIDSEDLGSRFMLEEWGYPNIGIVICSCPSAGHDAIMLDYSSSGNTGEPQVVHVNVETGGEPEITFLAKDFETFILGLVNETVYDTTAEDQVVAFGKVDFGAFSPALKQLFAGSEDPRLFEQSLRRIGHELVEIKTHFSLHADLLSYLVYDILFHLFSSQNVVRNKEQYLAVYPSFLVFEGEFSTNGYAPAFVEDWIQDRLESGKIKKVKQFLKPTRLCFTPEYVLDLMKTIRDQTTDT
ncbi:MAG TPA: SMI1/KNR4 family protein [Leptospiraceae bacterium]|nr:SMI1/KNR4 family protein [Leptospiraceae bacterium]HNN76091.1 SMI1/KNR4 family protein [Leptospiraceae bacterium]HQI18205.1 SMI1/KNR4 family protein [Leptospiraceae bacterium]